MIVIINSFIINSNIIPQASIITITRSMNVTGPVMIHIKVMCNDNIGMSNAAVITSFVFIVHTSFLYHILSLNIL